MAPSVPEEVDVFSIPHSRMKELVDNYFTMVQTTNFTNLVDLQLLLATLSRTFREFKSHEQIENQFIMKRLKHKLKKLSIQNTAVCNCHKDNALTDMLMLLKDGYRKKTEQDRLNYGLQLKKALESFTSTFLPHMQEEEEVFQPLLLRYFTYEELCDLKIKVIQQHLEQELEKSCMHSESRDSDTSDSDYCALHKEAPSSSKLQPEEKQTKQLPITSLPPEVVMKIFKFLPPQDLTRCTHVSTDWGKLAMDPVLWKHVLPGQWAKGDWSFDDHTDPAESEELLFGDTYESVNLDDDADIDESEDQSYSTLVQQARAEARILNGLCRHVLPKVGTNVQKLVLANCRTLTNGTLQQLMTLCPNVEHLDVSQTRITDAGLKWLGKNGHGSKLKLLNLSGCINITDATMVRLAVALSSSSRTCPSPSQHCYQGDLGSEVRRDNEDKEDSECLCDLYFKACSIPLPDMCRTPCGYNSQSDVSCGCYGDRYEDLYCTICDENSKTGNKHDKRASYNEKNEFNKNIAKDSIQPKPCCHCDNSEKTLHKPHVVPPSDPNLVLEKLVSAINVEALLMNIHDAPPDIPSLRGAPTEIEPVTTFIPHSLPISVNHAETKSASQRLCHTCCSEGPQATDFEPKSLEDCLPGDWGDRRSRLAAESLNRTEVGRRNCCKKQRHTDRTRNLEYLNLSGCYQLTDIGIRALTASGTFPRLWYLDLSGCFHLTAACLQELVAVCPGLQASQLYYCDNIVGGPYADTASGCRNLQCSSRVCCRSGD